MLSVFIRKLEASGPLPNWNRRGGRRQAMRFAIPGGNAEGRPAGAPDGARHGGG